MRRTTGRCILALAVWRGTVPVVSALARVLQLPTRISLPYADVLTHLASGEGLSRAEAQSMVGAA